MGGSFFSDFFFTLKLLNSLNYIEALNSLAYLDMNSYNLSKINATIVGYTTKYFQNGGFEFSDLTLLGEPKKTYFLLISSQSLTDKTLFNPLITDSSNEVTIINSLDSTQKTFSYYYYIPVTLRNCTPGEILVNLTNSSNRFFFLFIQNH